MSRANLLRLAVVATLLVAAPAHADLLMDFTGGFNASVSDTTRGYQFTTTTAFTVTDLAVWDFNQNGAGLRDSHLVTLYTSTGEAISSATVASGAGTPSLAGANTDGVFRTVDVPDFTLPSGTYVISAYYATSNDPGYLFGTPTPIAGITYDEGRTASGNAFPSTSSAQTFFGPSLIGSAAVIPEAGTLALVLPTSGILIGLVRRKRNG